MLFEFNEDNTEILGTSKAVLKSNEMRFLKSLGDLGVGYRM